MSKNEQLRQKIEQVLWKHYDPDCAMNAEEVMDDIMPLILSHRTEEVEKIRRSIGKIQSAYDEDRNSYDDCKQAGYDQGIADALRILEGEIWKNQKNLRGFPITI